MDSPPITLAQLAAHKRLSLDFLKHLGLYDLPGGGVGIPYCDETGVQLAVKRRPALAAKDGSFWPKGKPLATYGDWRLDRARAEGLLILVEGESDCWALWHHGLPALGLPGSNTTQALTAEHLAGLPAVYVHREPDPGGDAFVRGVTARLAALAYAGRLYDLRMPEGVKDPADLHAQDPARFKPRLEECIKAAKPLALPAGRERLLHERHAEARQPRARVISLAGVRRKAVQWLMPGWIPQGKITCLDGDPDLGKSTVLLDIAARVTTHGLMPNGEQGATGHVVLLSAEDDLEDTIWPRLNAAGADFESLSLIEDVDGHPVVLPQDLPAIEEVIVAQGAKLLVIDPLMAFLEADARSDQEVRRALYPVKQMAGRTGCAVVYQRHLNKGAGAKAMYRGGGSIGIIAAARAGILVALDPTSEQHRVFAQTKKNLAPLQRSLRYRLDWSEEYQACQVAWCGTTDLTADDLLTSPESKEQRTQKEEAVEFLQTFLANGPQPATEVYRVAKEHGITDEPTLRRAKAAAGVEARPLRDSGGAYGGWEWFLPETCTLDDQVA
jgi:AAA domain